MNLVVVNSHNLHDDVNLFCSYSQHNFLYVANQTFVTLQGVDYSSINL